MIAKLRENPDKIPSPIRDEIMKMCKAAFEETIAKFDVSDASKKKWIDNQTNNQSLTIKALKTTWSWFGMK